MNSALTLSRNSAVLGGVNVEVVPLHAGSLGEYGPLGFDAGDDNLYRYVGNDPTDEIDPTGLKFKGGIEAERQFFAKLAQTPEQKALLAKLVRDPEFIRAWNYLRTSSIEITLSVEPGLKVQGKERFGSYNPTFKTLRINPTKPEHLRSPIELMETLIHEMVHATQDVRKNDPNNPSPYPLRPDVFDTTTDPMVQNNEALKNLTLIPKNHAALKTDPALEQHMKRNYGDSDSNPAEYKDLNTRAQAYIDGMLQRIQK